MLLCPFVLPIFLSMTRHVGMCVYTPNVPPPQTTRNTLCPYTGGPHSEVVFSNSTRAPQTPLSPYQVNLNQTTHSIYIYLHILCRNMRGMESMFFEYGLRRNLSNMDNLGKCPEQWDVLI